MFNFAYTNRDNELQLKDLGMTVGAISQITPGGMLIFFPSYWMLEKCYEIWELHSIILNIEKTKKVFREPKDPTKYQATMDGFYKAIFKNTNKKHTGAILMGVCRGRISEGLDFSDKAARCVIMIGIPYPQISDPKVILKKDYLTRKASNKVGENGTLTGQAWYN